MVEEEHDQVYGRTWTNPLESIMVPQDMVTEVTIYIITRQLKGTKELDELLRRYSETTSFQGCNGKSETISTNVKNATGTSYQIINGTGRCSLTRHQEKHGATSLLILFKDCHRQKIQ